MKTNKDTEQNGRNSADTPMMRHYIEMKALNPDSILFYRCGDFYEMFFEDAKTAARELDLTLTTRDRNAEDPVPMAGVPHHAAQQYISRLIEKGYKVAVCEQVEDPRQAKGMVKRDIVRIVTPGLLLDSDNLEPVPTISCCRFSMKTDVPE